MHNFLIYLLFYESEYFTNGSASLRHEGDATKERVGFVRSTSRCFVCTAYLFNAADTTLS